MIVLATGDNLIVVPRQDLPDPLPMAVVVRLTNSTTGRVHWCEVSDDEELADWCRFTLTVVAANALPANGEIALRDAGDYVLDLMGGATYSESPNTLDLLRSERARYGI